MSYNYNAGAGPGPGTGHHNNTFGDHDFAYDDKSFYCYPHYQQTHTAARTENLLIELRRLWDLWTVPRPLSQSEISLARVISLEMLTRCLIISPRPAPVPPVAELATNNHYPVNTRVINIQAFKYKYSQY